MASFEIIGTDYASRISYTVTQNVEKNRSAVKVTKVEVKALGAGGFPAYLKGTISVNGVQTTVLAMTDTISCGITLTQEYAGGGEDSWSGFSTKGVTIYHEEDGSATIPIKVNLAVYKSLGFGKAEVGSAISKTVRVSLPTIPRVSELSASSVELGSEMSIRINRASEGFRDTVGWSCGELSGTIATKTAETELRWTVPMELASQEPNRKRAGVTLTLTTYQANTEIGTRVLMMSCGIPETIVPTLTFSVADKLGYSEAFGGYVQSQSQARVITNAEGSYGSTIERVSVTCGRLTGTGADISFALEDSGTVEISVTVTDSRGRTAREQREITVLPYRKPTVTVTEGYRCDAAGERKPDGEWLKLVFDSQVTALQGNRAVYTGSCTVHDTEQTRQVSLTDYEGQFQVTGGSFLISAGMDTAYDCKISVQDLFTTVESDPVLITVAFALLDLCRATKAVGIGMRARKKERLNIGLAADMNEHAIENLADPVNEQDAATKAYVDSRFPIGAIYISASDISPASLFGGTWEKLKDRFLVGAGNKYSAGDTGGADSVALTAKQMPEHRHDIGYNVVYRQTVTSGGGVRNVVSGGESSTSTGSAGSGEAHENRPPYLAVNMWKRLS